MRTCAVCALSFGGSTKVVSDRLNSPAIACICSAVSPSAFGSTASGLPPKQRSVETSTVTNSYCTAHSCSNSALLDDLVRASHQAGRQLEAHRVGCLLIDHEREP